MSDLGKSLYAIKMFNMVIELSPSCADAYLNRGL